jgi:hypothetical protein
MVEIFDAHSTLANQTEQNHERTRTLAHGMHANQRAFAFLRTNQRLPKPRVQGGDRDSRALLHADGQALPAGRARDHGGLRDALKFAGGSFSLMPVQAVKELIDLCHQYDVLVSTGGFLEHVLTQGTEAVERYIQECKDLGFDIIEISCGFITFPTEEVAIDQKSAAGWPEG